MKVLIIAVKIQSPLSLQLLFSSERLSKLDKLKDLSSKKIVITTRYSYSALAYGAARGINKTLLKLLERDMPCPDIKIFLHISVSESIKRGKDPDSIEKNYNLLKKVSKEYESIIKKEKDWHVVNAEQPIDKVFCDIKQIIKENMVFSK